MVQKFIEWIQWPKKYWPKYYSSNHYDVELNNTKLKLEHH